VVLALAMVECQSEEAEVVHLVLERLLLQELVVAKQTFLIHHGHLLPLQE
jgi:hypothetical protein